MNITINKRIEYIDAMRGFTMFLVVIGHVIFSYKTNLPNSYCNIFNYFRMPLFFFVSGWVFYKADRIWDTNTLRCFLGKKFHVQIIPSIVFMCLYVYINEINIVDAIFDKYKSHYWFTYTLFIYFILYSITSFVLPPKIDKAIKHIILLSFSILIFCFSFSIRVIHYEGIVKDIFGFLSIEQWRYFIFFCFGTIVKDYYNKFCNLTDNRYFMAFIICSFFLLVLSDKTDNSFIRIIITIFSGITGIVIVLSFFRKNERYFSKETTLGKSMQYVGRRTLDIYVLHYFFSPISTIEIGKFFQVSINPVLEFFVSGFIAILVILICLIVSNVIRMSSFLGHHLFGVKLT